ncbi:dehydrogenase [Candidatus Acidianus copahuensis]|uniref:Dehydrogenase n=1 Tax=Candidatus Acidianus copahuensis TaxID=1160895 RepID=A0A031LM90_9CREN|nr:molecular chaperone TorD family protein [Candidatus Acidianus copahuensis]EZQ02013.1 dehydrogenase [Candidatus Acidianus copahuensis]
MISVETELRYYIYDFFGDLFIYNYDENDYNLLLDKMEKLSQVKEFRELVNINDIQEIFKKIERKDYLIEFSTLFLSGNSNLIPIESKRLYSLQGEKVAIFKKNDIIRFYRSRKLALAMSFFQPEADHIASIMAFMSYLVSEENKKRRSGLDPFSIITDERNFFTSHVYNWIPEWAKEVIADKRSFIYKLVCQRLLNFLQVEKDYLGV